MTRDIILAVDDQPERYAHLAQRLAPHGLVVAVVCDPGAAEILLDSGRVCCAFLDHDMPGWNGQHYAREVFGPRGCPVAISSANRAGSRAIAEILRDFAVPFSTMSILDAAPEERWLGFVLDWRGRRAGGPSQAAHGSSDAQ